MVAAVHADISLLLDALSAGDEARLIDETIELLGPGKVPPAHIAARVAIPAAWGGGDGHPLLVLGAAGKIAEWMRAIPAGPEPGAEQEIRLQPALPLVQGFMAVADRVRVGLPEPHPDLPPPLTPFEITAPGGALEALREAFTNRDTRRFASILMGYYRTGTDYRALMTSLYAVLAHRYTASDHALIFAVGSARVLDMADWGVRVPPLIYWLVPLLMTADPDEAFVEPARQFAATPDHDLAWVAKRLAVAKEDAAGPALRRAVLAGDTAAACAAVLAALRAGASTRGVASGLSLAAAERLLTVAPGDTDSLLRAGHALQYTHAVHRVMRQTQDVAVYPLLYTAAAAVNALRTASATAPANTAPASAPLSGGLIAAALLRSLEQQASQGDAIAALATARRYIQMGHSPRSLAGVLGNVASQRDARTQGQHTLPLVAAAAEEYLEQPDFGGPSVTNQPAGQSALLSAAVRLASELPGDTAVAGHVARVIARRLASA
jgi:hypothetical protein